MNTDFNTGIIGDEHDLRRRQECFGKHSIPIPKIQTYFTILCQQFEDSNVIFLTWAASLYLVFSIFGTKKTGDNLGYLESLTIYFGLMFAANLAAVADWIKQRQHLSLKDEINNQKVTVYRGAFGTAISVPIRELVAGDIVQINQGDRVPADCIILDEINLEVDESMYGKNREKVRKEESQQHADGGEEGNDFDNHKQNPDFLLFSDSKVMRGEGRAIVCSVGDATLISRHRKKEDLVIKEQETLLEQKLEKVA